VKKMKNCRGKSAYLSARLARIGIRRRKNALIGVWKARRDGIAKPKNAWTRTKIRAVRNLGGPPKRNSA